ncbi:MAG: fibro-slime domain-containing protein, partial [Planctomycetes bacterium]|nr:fibro-slime domain-containing protein [Planctomycetota bacterium]
SQFFEVGGADDVYLFIDGRLVIDMGGVMNEQEQIIEFDRLGLTDGETYQARFFYANRHTYSSEMSLRTNVEIIMPAITQIASAAFD